MMPIFVMLGPPTATRRPELRDLLQLSTVFRPVIWKIQLQILINSKTQSNDPGASLRIRNARQCITWES